MTLPDQSIPDKPLTPHARGVIIRKAIRDSLNGLLGGNGLTDVVEETPNLHVTINSLGKKYEFVVVIKPSAETTRACDEAESTWQIINQKMQEAAETKRQQDAEKKIRDAAAFNADAKAAGTHMMDLVRQKHSTAAATTEAKTDTNTETQTVPVIPSVTEIFTVSIFGHAIFGLPAMPVGDELAQIREQSKPVTLREMVVTKRLAPSTLDPDKLTFQTTVRVTFPEELAKNSPPRTTALAVESFFKGIIDTVRMNGSTVGSINPDAVSEMHTWLSHKLRNEEYIPPKSSIPENANAPAAKEAMPAQLTAEEIENREMRRNADNARRRLIGLPPLKAVP